MAQGIRKASKKAAYNAKVDSIGNLGKDKSLFSASLTAIEKALGEFISRVKGNIQKEDMVVTGKIEDITLDTDNNSVNVYANPWLIYQDRGVSGTQKKYNTPHAFTDKMPPADVFKDYIKRKNLQLRDNKKYYGKESPFKDLTEEEQIERIAFAMARSVFQNGIEPRKIFTKEIPQLLEDLDEIIGEVLIQQINLEIDIKPDSKGINLKL